MIYFTGKLAGRQAQGQRLYSQVSAGGAGRCILPDFTVNFELNAPLRFYDKFSCSEHLRTKKEVMMPTTTQSDQSVLRHQSPRSFWFWW
jgi:hypothetical protein